MKITCNTIIHIYCETREEQEECLDIFEMLGKRWWSGHEPRNFRSHNAPMYYYIDMDGIGHSGNCPDNGKQIILARDLHNQWVQLCIEHGRK